ncbi:hypothetical protein BJ138DRAFT_955558 [Hygrophoropsis aurantiaca]|uniref:Uncharacterized protein n=1 Tax=Hygrophoropsis aurantiaca TaxID=72124 RepID=A0ACB7ZTP2_9AGAM|nr:hypothetical protein BJ138DRAFT_955558 [Hygrophoropsis aurantiaca]
MAQADLDFISPPDEPSTHAAIQSLPVELLQQIFKFVYLQNREKNPFRTQLQLDQTRWVPLHSIDVHPASPHMFPYALASVCTWWRDIMASTPEYWTRVISILDAPSPISVRSCFEWSRNLPLDVYVTRTPKRGWAEQDPQRERAQVGLVMDCLRPNIPRCTSIHFDVVHASSLPLLRADFHGEAPGLRWLELTSRLGDEAGSPRYGLDTTLPWRFSCPELTRLSLDGVNFASAPQLLDSVEYLSFLRVSHYKASRHTPWRLRAHDVCSAARDQPLRTLIVRNIEFDASGTHAPAASRLLGVQLLAFHEMASNNDIMQTLACMGDEWPVEIVFRKSRVGALSCAIPGNVLHFRCIAADQDLSVPLTGWRGYTLHVFACPCFDDRLLRALTHADGRSSCKRLERLHISECTNFSVCALKGMVKRRRNVSDVDIACRIQLLHVSGGPRLESGDRAWFQQNVPEFSWTL